MRRRRRKKLPTEPIALDIEKLSHEGRGIAHHEGKVVFVEGALAGEKVEAVLTSRRDSYDEARVQTVLSSSPARVEPPCQFYSMCGGCSLQHLEAQAQITFKQNMLFEKLTHAVGHAEYEKVAPMTGPVLGYRRKARLAVRYVHKKEQVLVGFREKHSTFITHMDHCEVLDERIAGLLPELPGLIGGLTTFRAIPQIEVAAGDLELEGVTFALIFRHLEPLPERDVQSLLDFAREKSFALYLQPGGMETVHKVFPMEGIDRLYYRLPEFDLTLGFHPTDFTQVNAQINRQMISKTMELLDLQPEDSVLDLFCGLGNFTLPVARHCKQVIGIEGSETMVERGSENARANGLTNTSFYAADLAQPLASAEWIKQDYNKVILDPPRSGAIEILPEIVKLAPERIVYISCNPATLARDAAFLEEHGYSMFCAGAMDMFPQTAHVESMAMFKKVSG